MRKSGHELYRCAACDHIFVRPYPSDEELARVYSFAGGYQRQAAVRFADQREFDPKFVASVEQLARHVTRGEVLDLGCSSGEFLWLARQRGFGVQGVELNPDTAAMAQANGLPVFVGRLEDGAFGAAAFDAVHLGDVIEHVKDPEGVLRRVHELLRPGGVALVITPNHDAFFPRATYRLFRATGTPWSHPTPPFHLNQFSVTSLTRLLEQTGFRVTERRYAPCSLPYELRSTGVFGRLKAALRARQPLRAVTLSALGAWVGASYTALWLLDRAAWAKRKDFTMRFVAARS